jgi:hypothetical protein
VITDYALAAFRAANSAAGKLCEITAFGKSVLGKAQKTKPRRSRILPEEFAGNDEPAKQTLSGLSRAFLDLVQHFKPAIVSAHP